MGNGRIGNAVRLAWMLPVCPEASGQTSLAAGAVL
jgi:hypothetical protein